MKVKDLIEKLKGWSNQDAEVRVQLELGSLYPLDEKYPLGADGTLVTINVEHPLIQASESEKHDSTARWCKWCGNCMDCKLYPCKEGKTHQVGERMEYLNHLELGNDPLDMAGTYVRLTEKKWQASNLTERLAWAKKAGVKDTGDFNSLSINEMKKLTRVDYPRERT